MYIVVFRNGSTLLILFLLEMPYFIWVAIEFMGGRGTEYSSSGATSNGVFAGDVDVAQLTEAPSLH